MPRQNITDLSPDYHRLMKGHRHRAQRPSAYRKEIEIRSRSARRMALKFTKLAHRVYARRLADRLDGIRGYDGRWSAGNPLHVGTVKDKLTGALKELYNQAPAHRKPTTITIIPATWEIPVDRLDDFDVVAKLEAFRADIYANGAKASRGWLFAYVHGEYDPIAKVVRIHIHALATPAMVKVIDRLRELPRYKAIRTLPDGSPNPVYRRVWVNRKPLTNLPDPLTYIMQTFWPARPIYIDEQGKRHRIRQKRRIREPVHTQILLWLDRWQVHELSLLVGLQVKGGRLMVSSGRR